MKSYNKNIDLAILDLLDKAKYSVRLNVPWFTHTPLFERLRSLAKKGLNVEMIIEDDEINRNTPFNHEELYAAGGHVYWHKKEKGLNHEKFCLIDEKILIYGSFNWTFRAANHNNESIIVIEREGYNHDFFSDFLTRFNTIKKSFSSKSSSDANETAIGNSADVEFIKLQIMILESEIASLKEEKLSIERVYGHIVREWNVNLSDLILRKSKLEQQLSELKAKQTQKKFYKAEAEEMAKAYQDTQKRLQDLTEEETPKNLNDKDLKKIYYEAIRMAHPDKYEGQHVKQERAKELSQILTEAYKKGDKETIEKILHDLIHDIAFGFDWNVENNLNKLEKLLKKLTEEKGVLEQEIKNLKASSMAEVFEDKVSLEEYIEAMRTKLERDITILEKNLTAEKV